MTRAIVRALYVACALSSATAGGFAGWSAHEYLYAAPAISPVYTDAQRRHLTRLVRRVS